MTNQIQLSVKRDRMLSYKAEVLWLGSKFHHLYGILSLIFHIYHIQHLYYVVYTNHQGVIWSDWPAKKDSDQIWHTAPFLGWRRQKFRKRPLFDPNMVFLRHQRYCTKFCEVNEKFDNLDALNRCTIYTGMGLHT